MKGSSYRDRDYAFGQAMLNLRMAIGLTQAGLAEHLGVSRKAVGEWEAGLTYPKAEHLKAFIVLIIEQQAFPAGREEEEILAVWQAAHQKMPLDEVWLTTLLPDTERPQHPTKSRRPLAPPPSSLLLLAMDHVSIGVMRPPSQPSMGVSGNCIC